MRKFFYFLGLCLMLTGCQPQQVSPVEEVVAEAETFVEPAPEPTRTVKLVAVGDIMSHLPQVKAARQEDGSYNYDEVFSLVKPYISNGDIAVANLEVPLAGAERKYSGYPLFNAPDALAEAIKQAGFDLVTTANNHCLDKGEQGLIRTVEVLANSGLKQVGTNPEPEDSIEIMEVNGLKLAFLAYTYGTNGIPIPKEKAYLVSLLEQDQILADIEKAKSLADFVIVLPHWGNEYWRQPSDSQQQLAAVMIEAGADLVLGSHPHVLQPYEEIKRANGQGAGVVVYSLGNFVSNQKDRYTDAGVIMQLELSLDGATLTKKVEVAGYVPTWVQRRRDFVILPLDQAIDPTTLTASEEQKLEQARQDTEQLLGKERVK